MSSIPVPSAPAAAGEPLLSVRQLNVSFGSHRGAVHAVRGVSFDVGREKVAIVGESGSGKSTVGRAILKLLPDHATVEAATMRLGEVDLAAADEKQMRAIRGRQISMILQDPKYSLNPVISVGRQIAEAYRVHNPVSKAAARARALEMLEAVRIRDPRTVYDLYPHQVSGGMGQRIMIAMMLAPQPRIIIADEPTSALDVTVRLQVLSILDDLVQKQGIGLVFITHDLNLVRSFCDRVLIMYAGRVVEELAADALDAAKHPYTRGLLDSLPRIEMRKERLTVLQRDPSWLNG
jgi:peptide/nickel transport system ATP-binding protein